MKNNNRLLSTLVIVVPMLLIIIAPEVGVSDKARESAKHNITKQQ